MSPARVSFSLGASAEAFAARLEALENDGTVMRVWAKDHTLWSEDDPGELVDRLGWLHLPARMDLEQERLLSFGDRVRKVGIERVVLLGMGGSSLAPEVFQHVFGNAEGFPELLVLDSTHPDAVAAVEAALDLEHTLFVVSSKSGTTIETSSLFRYFWDRASAVLDVPGEHFVAITDPGSELEQLARDHEFAEIFGAPPEVGGRYSALTTFGLVPAALIGVDLEQLEGHATAIARTCAQPKENPGLELGVALAELALAGRTALTFVVSPGLAAFPAWLEQLIAESTGKDSKGILPVVGEPLAGPEAYGPDRVFVALELATEQDPERDAALASLEAAGHPLIRCGLDDPFQLGGEIFRWEFAVAVASAVLAIHPFNQPDVQLAKSLARKAMEDDDPSAAGTAASDRLEAVSDFLAAASPGDYVAVQAFLAPTEPLSSRLAELQAKIRARFGVATTVGFGPRFLHSTGQLHKGGPETGLFVQLVDRPGCDLDVPGTDFSFSRLIAAQARGDATALAQRQRRVLTLDLGDAPEEGVEKLIAALG